MDNWCKAYPLTVFIEPSPQEWDQIRDVLNYNGLSLDAVSGSCMRHVVDGIRDIAKQALEGGKSWERIYEDRARIALRASK